MFSVNDKVIVCFTTNCAFPWMNAPYIEATILYMPQATGDCFQFQHNDIVFMVNPNSSDFIGLSKLVDQE